MSDPTRWRLKHGEPRIVVEQSGDEVADCSMHKNAEEHARLIAALPAMLALLREHAAGGVLGSTVERLLDSLDNPSYDEPWDEDA